jgi:hypothetical protein
MSERISCCVPYCRRTHHNRERFSGWICAKHWALVSRSTKTALRVNKRRIRTVLRQRPEYAEYWKMPPGSPRRLRAVAMWARHDQIWQTCKAEAVERAAGI